MLNNKSDENPPRLDDRRSEPTLGKKNNRKQRPTNFRTRKNDEFQRDLDDKLDKKLYVTLSSHHDELVKLAKPGKTNPLDYPVTTRGIGLNIMYSLNSIESKYPQFLQRSHVTPQQIYRVGLSQFSYAVYMARKSADLSQSESPNHPLGYAAFELTSGCKQNLQLVASSINSVGIVERDGKVHVPFVPELKTEMITISRSVQSTRTMPVMRIDPTTKSPVLTPEGENIYDSVLCSVAVDEDTPIIRVIPDPYLVTITNLRDQVTYLSSPETPQHVREYFRKHSPLPGARWDENSVLLNPDEIIPDNYDNVGFMSDSMNVNSLMTLLGSKDHSKVGTVFYEVVGLPSILCTSEEICGDSNTENIWNIPRIDVHTQLASIADIDYVVSILCLMSELPCQTTRELEYWYRLKKGSVKKWVDQNRLAYINSALN